MQLVIDNSRCFGTEVGSMLRGDVLQKLVDLCIIKPQCTSPKYKLFSHIWRRFPDITERVELKLNVR